MSVALAYLTLCVVWGTTYLAIKIVLEGFDPFFMGGVRFLIAGLCLVPLLKIRSSAIPKNPTTLFWIIVSGIFMLPGANGLVNFAEVYLDSGLTALTVCTSPAWSALIGGFFFSHSERLNRWSFFGIVMAMLGVYVLHHERLSFAHAEVLGVLAAVIAPILWAIGSLMVRSHAKGTDVMIITAIQSLAATIVFFVISLVLCESWQPELNARVVGWLAYLIIIGTIVTYAAYAYVLRHMPASRATTYAFVNPVIALIAGNIILSEPITAEFYPATLLILGGLLLVYWGHYRVKADVR